MTSLQEKFDAITPSGKHSYIDVIAGWVKEFFHPYILAFIQAECGKNNVIIRVKRARFGRGYRVWFRIIRPTDAVLRFLATLNDLHLNYVEFAHDLIFQTEFDLENARYLIDRHIVKKWPSKRGSFRIGKGDARTFYSSPRGSRNLLAYYSDRPSRITGETDCLHLEWRISRSAVLRALGITTTADLIGFDFYSFWKRRFLVYEYDAERFGRYHSNWYFKSNRRKPIFGKRAAASDKWAYSVDRSVGNLLFRWAGSVQQIIETWNRKFDVRRAFKPISVEHLLPKRLRKKCR